jgi:hypothetical protein
LPAGQLEVRGAHTRSLVAVHSEIVYCVDAQAVHVEHPLSAEGHELDLQLLVSYVPAWHTEHALHWPFWVGVQSAAV